MGLPAQACPCAEEAERKVMSFDRFVSLCFYISGTVAFVLYILEHF